MSEIDTGLWRAKLERSFNASTPDGEANNIWAEFTEQGSTILDAHDAQAARIAELEAQVAKLQAVADALAKRYITGEYCYDDCKAAVAALAALEAQHG